MPSRRRAGLDSHGTSFLHIVFTVWQQYTAVRALQSDKLFHVKWFGVTTLDSDLPAKMA
jgi:hypothetical protein